jgi:hypothetical protein
MSTKARAMLKLLQIAVSLLSVAVSVLVIMMWVRSYSWLDRVDWPVGRLVPGWTATTVSVRGLVLVGAQPEQYNAYANQSTTWRVTSGRVENARVNHLERGTFGFKIIRGRNELGLQLPTPAVVAALGICSLLPWVKWGRRFGLRMLLVAISLAAAVLGLIVTLG